MQNCVKNHYQKGNDNTGRKKLDPIFKETEELIAIVAKSISTVQKNKGK